MKRYGVKEDVYLEVELFDANGNRVTGANVILEILRPDNTVLQYTMLEDSTFAPGRYYYIVPSSDLPQEGIYRVKYVTAGFDPAYDYFMVKNYPTTLGVGAGIYAVDFIFTDDQSQPVPDVRFVVLDLNKTQVLHSGVSDANGRASLNLDADTYYVRPYKTGYNFVETAITVNSDGSFTFVGQPVVLSPAPDPQFCRVHIYIVDFGLQPRENIPVYVDLADLPSAIGSKLGSTNRTSYMTDADGYIFIDLPRLTKVYFEIPEAKFAKAVLIPDLPAVNIVDLL